jgi:hypothetical protein
MALPRRNSLMMLSHAMQASLFEFCNRWLVIFFIFFVEEAGLAAGRQIMALITS